ncbi:MAG: acetylxylan esterase [Eubacteriales bacterium]|nr:acetylxylan esterase [Eubacteriales bacterium]
MPILDMPLEKLQKYCGRNECPADIDRYWDEAVAEMEALGTAYTLEKADFQVPGAECYHLYFVGVGGARIHSIFLRPEKRNKKLPAVLEFHGYSGNCGSFRPKLAWVAAGYCVAAMDCRGQGGLSQDTLQCSGNTLHGHIIRGLFEQDPRQLYYRGVFLDTAQLARIVMSMDFVDPDKVGAYGGSQGGGLTIACASLTPRLNRACPQMPFLSDYRRAWEMDLAKDAYQELQDYFRRFDPLHKQETAIFTRLGYIDIQHMAHRIQAKVRMYTGLMDNICPPSTQFAAYNKMTCPKEVVLYPDFKHESFPGMEDDVMQFMLKM